MVDPIRSCEEPQDPTNTQDVQHRADPLLFNELQLLDQLDERVYGCGSLWSFLQGVSYIN
jgi:hypothetical protein